MIYIDSKIDKEFITKNEVLNILENDPDTVVNYKGIDIIVSKNRVENSIYVELYNSEKKKKYMRLKNETV